MDEHQDTQTYVNDSETSSPINTGLTQNRSPGVLGFTYFIRVDDAIKIGSATSPKDRISALQTAHEKPLDVLAVVPAALVDEYKAHQLFAHLRIRGEWFRAEQDLLYFIEQAKIDAQNEPPPARAEPAPARPKAASAPSQQEAIRQLINARANRYGAETPEGHTCSNMAEMLKNMRTYVRPEWALDERQTLPWMIKQQMKRLAPRAIQ